jgi:hypothetical protein
LTTTFIRGISWLLFRSLLKSLKNRIRMEIFYWLRQVVFRMCQRFIQSLRTIHQRWNHDNESTMGGRSVSILSLVEFEILNYFQAFWFKLPISLSSEFNWWPSIFLILTVAVVWNLLLWFDLIVEFRWQSDWPVHQLWPPSGDGRRIDLNVVFFHGLQLTANDVNHAWTSTWTQRGHDNVCWPREWLPCDLGEAVRVFSGLRMVWFCSVLTCSIWLA